MKQVNFKIDEETANLLSKHKNKSEALRTALKVYNGYISPDKEHDLLSMLTQLDERLNALSWEMNELNKLMKPIVGRMNGEYQ